MAGLAGLTAGRGGGERFYFLPPPRENLGGTPSASCMAGLVGRTSLSYHSGELSQLEITTRVAGDITEEVFAACAIMRWDRRPGPVAGAASWGQVKSAWSTGGAGTNSTSLRVLGRPPLVACELTPLFHLGRRP